MMGMVPPHVDTMQPQDNESDCVYTNHPGRYFSERFPEMVPGAMGFFNVDGSSHGATQEMEKKSSLPTRDWPTLQDGADDSNHPKRLPLFLKNIGRS